jgi:cation diffusion facilitator CzcD-associated flavoprotein CzcO
MLVVIANRIKGAGFLEALVSPNVTPVHTPIECFTGTGIKTKDGKDHDFDVIISATGFQIGSVPFFERKGRAGQRLQDIWAEESKYYPTCHVPNHEVRKEDADRK